MGQFVFHILLLLYQFLNLLQTVGLVTVAELESGGRWLLFEIFGGVGAGEILFGDTERVSVLNLLFRLFYF